MPPSNRVRGGSPRKDSVIGPTPWNDRCHQTLWYLLLHQSSSIQRTMPSTLSITRRKVDIDCLDTYRVGTLRFIFPVLRHEMYVQYTHNGFLFLQPKTITLLHYFFSPTSARASTCCWSTAARPCSTGSSSRDSTSTTSSPSTSFRAATGLHRHLLLIRLCHP